MRVLANGCFDYLHYGHLRHLQAASKLGDFLIVSVTNDEFVNKGPGRPMFPSYQRASMLRALRCVDEVILVDGLLEALERTKPDILVKGKEYEGKMEFVHTYFCRMNDIKIVFTDEPVYSSTKIINELGSR